MGFNNNSVGVNIIPKSPIQYAKATIRGALASIGKNPPIVCQFQFNPDEYIDSRDVKYADLESPGATQPMVQYTGGGARTINFKLLLYARETPSRYGGINTESVAGSMATGGGLRRKIYQFQQFMYPKVTWEDLCKIGTGQFEVMENSTFKSPPPCIFVFGQTILECVMTKCEVSYKAFNAILDPIEAEINISLKENTNSPVYSYDYGRRIVEALAGSVTDVVSVAEDVVKLGGKLW